MKKIRYDFKKLSYVKMKKPPYVLYDPNIIKLFLNELMIQIDVLMKNSGTFGGIYKYIHKAQMFDLKPANIGIIVGENSKSYLIDIDGYLYKEKNTVNNNEWISSFPPIEFYKDKTLNTGQHITLTDLEEKGEDYYKSGKHISWMLGIVVYQMFCYFVKKKNSGYGYPEYFDFTSRIYDKLRYRKLDDKPEIECCTETNNLFTSLVSFINALPEPYKSQWKEEPSFLDEIKSCLYFNNGYYDESEEPLTWSPEGLNKRRPFYNADGSINEF